MKNTRLNLAEFLAPSSDWLIVGFDAITGLHRGHFRICLFSTAMLK